MVEELSEQNINSQEKFTPDNKDRITSKIAEEPENIEESFELVDKSSEINDDIHIKVSENSEISEHARNLNKENDEQEFEPKYATVTCRNRNVQQFDEDVHLLTSVIDENFTGEIYKKLEAINMPAKTFSPLYILALVAEMESERLKNFSRTPSDVRRIGPTLSQREAYKRRPGRPRNSPVKIPYSAQYNAGLFNEIIEMPNDSYIFRKIKLNRPYDSKDGEPQKITIQQRKDSDKSREGGDFDSSKSSMEKITDAYTIKKYGDIPESTFTTGWNDGVLVYICPEENCGKFFPSISRAKRHYIIHTEAKPYKCPNFGCNKRFSRKDNMNQHCRLHCKYAQY